ncbi:MAG TPA: hypothetical protein PLU81_05630 [Deltaproteobacteria bacterium]|nr:hypothetical protein [Deltaproteobacteria bacterium]HPJ92277.1 hypothetical protein [Deltaproteobacteria bacterium]HPR51247.1 hypothetical protein [Deltaproteobacteria bacterium]
MKRHAAALWIIIVFLSFLVPAYAQMPGYAELTKLLIDLDGWEAEEATGMNMSGPMGDMVDAVREYEKDGQTISAQIIVGGAAQGTWAPFSTGYTIETPEVLAKSLEESGYHIGINHDKQENTGGVVVLLNTKSTTGVFVLSYEKMDYQEALNLAKKFSWSAMEQAIE